MGGFHCFHCFGSIFAGFPRVAVWKGVDYFACIISVLLVVIDFIIVFSIVISLLFYSAYDDF